MTEYPKPQSSPVPPLILPFMPAQSPLHAGPTNPPAGPVSTPLPPSSHNDTTDTTSAVSNSSSSPSSSKPHPPKKPIFPFPTLRLEIRDLNHPGALAFLTAINTTTALQTAIQSVLTNLYLTPSTPTTTVPPTRSVTLILRAMPGVAYTTGSSLDDDHKEIHFSLNYIHQITPDRKHDEILGVLTHEMVHCYQYNAFNTCPGGLIEGIADWVRLHAGLSPPHWTREGKGDWDGGYQRTGYFLEYLEQRFGEGTVRRINERLRIENYDEKRFWTGLVGGTVQGLWKDYGEWLEKGKGGKGKEEEDVKGSSRDEEGCVIVEKEEEQTPTPTTQVENAET